MIVPSVTGCPTRRGSPRVRGCLSRRPRAARVGRLGGALCFGGRSTAPRYHGRIRRGGAGEDRGLPTPVLSLCVAPDPFGRCQDMRRQCHGRAR
ncbi:hypothetical protein FRACA_2200005 [Frankia canadensis]|uniref:Uncharacterized protein n=1 Tax=Frankia canadensis TaxID=1836972 RepID=A0A2I2KR11_9ACTN|nr:hypothetical protein FRACA_2200005 [Frankia canadensis]SOU55401.1 hypothetical protein FRACA_2200005 [Frankia canadensis]